MVNRFVFVLFVLFRVIRGSRLVSVKKTIHQLHETDSLFTIYYLPVGVFFGFGGGPKSP